MSREPHFSIMVPTYNQAHFLTPCLNSLVAQSDGDWEAVVVDDGSTDQTPEVLEAWTFKDPRVRVIRQENGGTAAALNTALRHCRGRWVGWLSSDDLFEPDKLEIQRAAQAEFPETLFFHTHFYHLEEDSGLKTAPRLWRPIPPPGLQVARFFSGNYVSGITICVERETLRAAAPFRTDLRHAQDFAMWLGLTRQTRSRFLDRRTAIMRWHSGQTTNAFPVAGLYDSAWACLDLLNAQPFPDLFPVLDLDEPGDAALAVNEILDISLWTGAFVYQLGYSPALLLRMAEWLHAPQGGPGRARGLELVRAPERLGQAAALPAPLRRAYERLASDQGPCPYGPEPVVDFIRQTIADPATEERKRRNLVRYLDGKRASLGDKA